MKLYRELMEPYKEIEELKISLTKVEGAVLFLLSFTAIQFLLIIILFSKR